MWLVSPVVVTAALECPERAGHFATEHLVILCDIYLTICVCISCDGHDVIASKFFPPSHQQFRRPKRRPPESRSGHAATPFPTIPRVGIMQISVLATARCAITTPSRRHSTSRGLGSARSLSSRTTRLSPTAARRPASFRVCRAGQVVAAAAAKNTCSRNLLVVGPGVLGSLVCQRWLNVRLRSARVVSAALGFFSPLASLFPRVSPLFILSDPSFSSLH